MSRQRRPAPVKSVGQPPANDNAAHGETNMPPRSPYLEDALRAEPELGDRLVIAFAQLVSRGPNATVAFVLNYAAVCADLWSLLGALDLENDRAAEAFQMTGAVH